MDLVVETIQKHQQPIVCTDGSGSSLWDEQQSFDMSIYRLFSRRDAMKTFTASDRSKNEFDLFIEYAEAKMLGAVDSRFDAIDEWLGTIGVTNEMCEV